MTTEAPKCKHGERDSYNYCLSVFSNTECMFCKMERLEQENAKLTHDLDRLHEAFVGQVLECVHRGKVLQNIATAIETHHVPDPWWTRINAFVVAGLEGVSEEYVRKWAELAPRNKVQEMVDALEKEQSR